MKQKIWIRICLISAFICVCCFFAWMFLRQKGTSQTTAQIIYQGDVIRTVDLSAVKKKESFTVGEPGNQNTIQISPDGIGIISADCRDQICVRQGIRSHGPEPIVCLPHRLSIRFTAPSPDGSVSDAAALDAVTGQ